MSVDLSNASLLSFSQENVEFSDTSLTFKRKKNFSVKGFLLDLANSNGVKKNIESSETFLESLLENNQEIILKGESLGESFINSFEVNGEFIRDAEYILDFTVFESLDLSKIEFSGGGNKLQFQGSDVTKDDLRLLNSFEENINISNSSNSETSIDHSVSCSFIKPKNIISKNLNLWTNASVQKNKLVNLNNKGKNSIKIQAGNKASMQVSNLSLGEEYILELEFLGNDESTQTSSTEISVSWTGGNSSNKILENPGFKKISFTPSSSSVQIELSASGSKNSFYKNVCLYKKRDTPLERSRVISDLFINSNPIYGLIDTGYPGIMEKADSWEKDNTVEVFNEINGSYSKSLNLIIDNVLGIHSNSFVTPTPDQKKYSLKRDISLNFDQEGVVSVEENSDIKILESATENDLNKVIQDIIDGSRNRCLEKLSAYSDRFDYGCSSSTPTPISTATFLKPLSKNITKNIFDKTCQINISFSNDLSIESQSYTHENSYDINFMGKNYAINYSGTLSGTDGTPEERYAEAKQAFNNIVVTNIDQNINLIKDRIKNNIDSNSRDNFIEKEKSITLNKPEGVISYSYLYTNEESGEKSSEGIIKNYEISINETKRVPKFNSFIFGCSTTAQMLGILDNPKQKTISIKSMGYNGKSIESIYLKSKEILTQKNLLLGEDSNSLNLPNNLDVFLAGESMSFSREDNLLSYTRDVLDLSECMNSDPRPTPTVGFGMWLSGVDPNMIHYPTPTIRNQIDDSIPFTPYEQTPTPFLRYYYPTPTVTLTETITVTETETITPTL